MRPEALAAWQVAQERHWHNPSSPYRTSASARLKLEECRERVALIVGARAEEVVFTSGATESNNAICAHLFGSLGNDTAVAVSSVEHPSVLEPMRNQFGARLWQLKSEKSGVVSLDSVEHAISQGARAVALMAANNETGVIMPWQEVAQLCRRHGVRFFCDAAQWLGKMPAKSLGLCDFFSGCAHKFGGPKGCGFLVSRYGAIRNIQLGGSQESGQRGGTENLPAIMAMVAALEAAERDFSNGVFGDTTSRDRCASYLLERLPEIRVIGSGTQRLWNTLSLEMPFADNSRWVSRLDRLGFQVSTGSACATGKAGPSHVLSAMGLLAEAARRVIRVSGGWQTTEADWQALAEAIVAMAGEIESDTETNAVIEIG